MFGNGCLERSRRSCSETAPADHILDCTTPADLRFPPRACALRGTPAGGAVMSGAGSRSWKAVVRIGLLSIGLCGVAAPAAVAGDVACVGDCNDDGVVAVNELIAGGNIRLRNAP